ncbi:hypothetical protein QYE76_054397 [Lolium multiflorum]|uniref:Reverse transcriptase domain-containing protein n=1 Tax=Lolium multiflorum TaxID=4521 RepID=A0AAD8SXM0_LOLMU|nr:hypothetical protein QYE76_054397 [Lolium multiflorum]
MATPHYAYNMMKMSGPSGIITVRDDPEMALECEDSGAKLADTVIASERDNATELAKYPVDCNDPAILEKPTELDSSSPTFQPTTDTRRVDLVENDPTCPKGPFVLPRIDQIIEAVAGSESLCFLDAYSGYNQIKMAVEDQEKTAFITPFDAYCYTAMTFVLRNARATYQRCMNSCLESQIGRNVHVYIDDVVVKSTRQDDLVADLTESFTNLQRYQIKLNPLKCTFGVPSGQLLGYVVSKRGIEPNLEKTSAVMRTKQPACLLDAQKLVGRVAALSRFIPRLGDKALRLYRLLKKSDSFEWTAEAQKALDTLKDALQSAPVEGAPRISSFSLFFLLSPLLRRRPFQSSSDLTMVKKKNTAAALAPPAKVPLPSPPLLFRRGALRTPSPSSGAAGWMARWWGLGSFNPADGVRASPAKRSTGGFADEDDLFDIDEGFIEPPPKKAKSDVVSPVVVASEASAPKAAPMAQASTASSLSKGKDISPTAATAAPFSGKGALARIHSMIFPKIKQEKTLGQLIDTFAVDTKEVIEVFKRTSRTFGAVLAFQLMMGYGFKGDIEEMTKGLPKGQDGQPIDLSTFKASALTCAHQLLELVSSRKSSTGPSSSTQTQLP